LTGATLTALRQRLAKFLKPYTRHEAYMLYLALAYLLVFEIIVQFSFPQFIRNQVIAEVSTLLATIEGVLIALSPQIRIKWIREWVAVGLGIPALMLSIIAVTVADFQSIQLGYLSQDLESYTFRADVTLFVLLVELYAIGILFTKFKDDQEPNPKGLP
jgi:hypothetical protein